MKNGEDKTNFLAAADAVTRNYCPKLPYFVSFSGSKFDKIFYDYLNGKIVTLMMNRKEDGFNGVRT